MSVSDSLEVPDPLTPDLKWAGICEMDCTVDLSVFICLLLHLFNNEAHLHTQIKVNNKSFYNLLLFCIQR